jgi:hypothetical protein
MTGTIPIDSLWAQSLGIPDLGLLLVKVLAVAGAAAVGWFGGGLFWRFACRLLFHRPLPATPLFLMRSLSALAVGLLIWFWVFSPAGAGGLGGGGGWWPFGGRGGQSGPEITGTADNTATQKASKEEVKAKQREKEDKKTKGLSVRMLGGRRVVEQKFYLMEDEAEPRTLAELKEAIEAQRGQNPALTTLTIILFPDSVDQANPAVTELKSWAEANGLTVTLSFP